MKKVYLITGASSDLGIAFLEDMDKRMDPVADECVVYGTYHQSGALLDEAKQRLRNVKLHAISCDLQDFSEIDRMLTGIQRDGNVPTHLVHLAAAKLAYTRFKDFDWEQVKGELDIQVGAFSYVCRWLLPQMARNRYGRILAVASSLTLGVPPKYMSDYVVTKYALLGLVKALASEFAGKGISINAISPEMMETKFLSQIDERLVEMNALNLPMKRNISLEETVSGMNYLLSDEASYINGINLNLSGGAYM